VEWPAPTAALQRVTPPGAVSGLGPSSRLHLHCPVYWWHRIRNLKKHYAVWLLASAFLVCLSGCCGDAVGDGGRACAPATKLRGQAMLVSRLSE
jgi:hypothetical protein